jgi:DNA mismatch repair protein MSH4
VAPIQELIDRVINEDTTYARQPLELRNQRIYAVKSGVNGLLDVARTTYKEASEDAYQHCTELGRMLRLSTTDITATDETRGIRPAARAEVRGRPPILHQDPNV